MDKSLIVAPTREELDRQLISEVAMDIGKELVAYIERMYPRVYAEMNGGAKLSVRNHIHNDIMAALGTIDADEIRFRLERRRKQRRDLLKMIRLNRDLTAESTSPPSPSHEGERNL